MYLCGRDASKGRQRVRHDLPPRHAKGPHVTVLAKHFVGHRNGVRPLDGQLGSLTHLEARAPLIKRDRQPEVTHLDEVGLEPPITERPRAPSWGRSIHVSPQ